MYTYRIMETSDLEEWLEKLQMDYILTKNVWWLQHNKQLH